MSAYWSELLFTVSAADAERAAAALTALTSGQLYIEDYSDMDEALPRVARVDYIDEELEQKDRSSAVIHLYLPAPEDACEKAREISALLTADGVAHELGMRRVREEDWADNWKRFYHVSRIGSGRLVIRPSWEAYASEPDDAVVTIDPGSSFGSGTHETTRLCLALVEGYLKPGGAVLDMGCGSGILSLAALALGASGALGVDIDPHAALTAEDNAALCGASAFRARCGDVLTDADFATSLGGGYDLVCANIVSDVLIAMGSFLRNALAADGVLIASGIIDERERDVRRGLADAGLRLLETRAENGWRAMVFDRADG